MGHWDIMFGGLHIYSREKSTLGEQFQRLKNLQSTLN